VERRVPPCKWGRHAHADLPMHADWPTSSWQLAVCELLVQRRNFLDSRLEVCFRFEQQPHPIREHCCGEHDRALSLLANSLRLLCYGPGTDRKAHHDDEPQQHKHLRQQLLELLNTCCGACLACRCQCLVGCTSAIRDPIPLRVSQLAMVQPATQYLNWQGKMREARWPTNRVDGDGGGEENMVQSRRRRAIGMAVERMSSVRDFWACRIYAWVHAHRGSPADS
jgi:hypothetical protein